MNQEKWIYVGCNHEAEIMPKDDCEVWIARGGCGKGWIQKIEYYVEQGCFDWDGIFAYQPVIKGELPEPYIKQFAGNKNIICKNII